MPNASVHSRSSEPCASTVSTGRSGGVSPEPALRRLSNTLERGTESNRGKAHDVLLNLRKAGSGETPPLRPVETVEAHGSELREWTEAIVIAFVLAIILRTFLIQAYKIPSGSMEPTLAIGDHIMVNKIRYGLRMPDSLFGLTPLAGEIPYGHYLFHFAPVHRGDVVVFVFPLDETKDFIKRVVGVAGDTVQVKNGQVFLNGAPMPDPPRTSRSRRRSVRHTRRATTTAR